MAASGSAWLHTLDGVDAGAERAVARLLKRHGIDVRGLADGDGPGAVVFDEPDAALERVLERASREGRERIVAVAHRPDGLAPRDAWRLLERGAADVVQWHDERRAAAEVSARLVRWAQVDEIVASDLVRSELGGDSAVWRSILREVVHVGRFTQSSVLIAGESGTGKELVARLIHKLDARPDRGQIVTVDCTTVVPSLSGSEFFGHERGAFTGAVAARDGAFALADGGTLFLDEVGELPPNLQAELLRVIQEGMYKRVGSNRWLNTDFRLVCATNRDLEREVEEGRFRGDLFHRIAAFRLDLPPLSARREDVIPLTRRFLAELAPDGEAPELDGAVRDLLAGLDYPGNVRGLRQLVGRIAVRHVGDGPITVGDVPLSERPAGPGEADAGWRDGALRGCVRRALADGAGLAEIRETAAELAVEVALADAGGSVKAASERLGVTARALQMREARRRTNGDGAA